MKNIAALLGFFAISIIHSEVFATVGTNMNPSNNTKETVDASGKDNSGKYSFTLFNFFNTQTKVNEDSTTVKKQEPAVLPKAKINSGL